MIFCRVTGILIGWGRRAAESSQAGCDEPCLVVGGSGHQGGSAWIASAAQGAGASVDLQPAESQQGCTALAFTRFPCWNQEAASPAMQCAPSRALPPQEDTGSAWRLLGCHSGRGTLGRGWQGCRTGHGTQDSTGECPVATCPCCCASRELACGLHSHMLHCPFCPVCASIPAPCWRLLVASPRAPSPQGPSACHPFMLALPSVTLRQSCSFLSAFFAALGLVIYELLNKDTHFLNHPFGFAQSEGITHAFEFLICRLFIVISVQKSFQMPTKSLVAKMQNHHVAVINFFFAFT